MITTVVFHDIPRFDLGLHLTPYLKKCDQKIFHGKFLYLSLRFEYYFTTQFCGVRCDHNSRYAASPDLVTTDVVWQRSLIWECSRAKLNLGGVCRKDLENGKVRIVIGGVRVCLVGIFAQYS